MEPDLLEDWLRVASSPSSSSSSTVTATAPALGSPSGFAASAVVQAWAEIRTCVQQKSVTASQRAAFELLNRHRQSLHYAESQAKLLLAVISEVKSSDAELLGYARRFAVLGILTWIRKSYQGTVSNPASLKLTPDYLSSVVKSACEAMRDFPASDVYACEVILLLGTVSSLTMVSQALRLDCLNVVALELHVRRNAINRGAIAEAIAGAGYAMGVSQEQHLVPILRALLQLWTPLPGAATMTEFSEKSEIVVKAGMSSSPKPEMENRVLNDSLMLLHLMDYLGSLFISRQGAQLELLLEELLRVPLDSTGCEMQCAAIMVTTGLLRSLYRWVQTTANRDLPGLLNHNWEGFVANLESLMFRICEQALAPNVIVTHSSASNTLQGADRPNSPMRAETMQLLRSIGIALSRCRGLPAHSGVLRCLQSCIFYDVLHLDGVYSRLLADVISLSPGAGQHPRPSLSHGEGQSEEQNGREVDAGLITFQLHVESFIFQEVGALVRAMCDQYRRSTDDEQRRAEQSISEFARKLYANHRVFVVTSRKSANSGWSQYGQTLEKVLDAAFLTVVVFFSVAVRQDAIGGNSKLESELAALALDSFSCVEYFRHVQLMEYGKVIKRSVARISDSGAGSLAFILMFPSYHEIIQQPGPFQLNLAYSWVEDEVQAARVLFYFRVLPLSLDKLPDATFAAQVAPTLFLYLQHPLEAMTKASHGLFGAFLSSGAKPESMAKINLKDPKFPDIPGIDPKPDMKLREQMVVLYIQRALETFPGATPFQGLVTGIGAIARNLPPGSPATVHCMACLVDKAANLFKMEYDLKNGVNSGSNSTLTDVGGETSDQQRKIVLEEMGAAQKLQILLLHLILIVDLQVLPELLKLVANLLFGLPPKLRSAALTDVFDIVASSDDYTRKPLLVPWLQSLSFLTYHREHLLENSQTLNQNSTEETCSSKTVRVSSSLTNTTSDVHNVSTSESTMGPQRRSGNPDITDRIQVKEKSSKLESIINEEKNVVDTELNDTNVRTSNTSTHSENGDNDLNQGLSLRSNL